MLGTVHVLGKVLICRYRTFFMGNNIICGTYWNNSSAAILYILGILFCISYIIVNTHTKINNNNLLFLLLLLLL
jgi:hypothetical protein